ncbi:MAG: helix-turn-helix domain-containing protein [Planctomycetes bacterium]|nr:helix-turn-helix domain-containing protein [Planctomycetota bacterium]
MLLEYLVPSTARREVWKTLHSQDGPLSVRELARRAGVSYSNAHREVMRMKELGLLRTQAAGRSLLCAWDMKNPAARKLAALLEVAGPEGGKQPTDDDIYANLKSWGAGLAKQVQPAQPLPLEETLAYGVELARRDPDIAQVWPVVLARNRARAHLDRLVILGRRLGQKRALGFLLSLTATLLDDATLLDFAKGLHDSRVRRGQDFFRVTRGKRAQSLAEANTPELARNWFFRMNTGLSSFRSHFDKFVPKT